MFVNSDFLDYDNIVEFSDNFIVLSKVSSVSATFDNPRTIPVVVQYLYPSTLCVVTTRTFRSNTSFEPIEVSDDFYSRSDCPQLISTIFICIFFLCFIINGLTKLFKRGGIFFGQ